MVLRRSLKTIQVEENSFHVPSHVKTEEHSKRDENNKICTKATGSCAPTHERCTLVHEVVLATTPCAPVRETMCPRAWLAGINCCLLVFQVGSMEKTQFYSLSLCNDVL